MPKISFFAPSYKRPQKSITQKVYPMVKLVVRESEAEEYLRNGNDIIVCPDSAQGNASRIRNWILDNLMQDNDAIATLDDDCKGIGLWQYQRKRMLNPEELCEFVESLAILTKDAGLYFFGMNCVLDKGAYREYTPFNFNNFIGGPFQGHIKGTVIRYDESLCLKEDYDITLQHLKEYGGALRANFAFYDVKQAEQVGGCASQRSSAEENRQFDLLQKKWGTKIIQRDPQSKCGVDFNPILKSPIRGV